MVDALLDAEESRDKGASPPITKDKLDKVEREGLCNEASVEIFVSWYMFGGIQHGISLTEILSMPTWLRRDFRHILTEITARRRDRERAGKMMSDLAPKKKGKRNAR